MLSASGGLRPHDPLTSNSNAATKIHLQFEVENGNTHNTLYFDHSTLLYK